MRSFVNGLIVAAVLGFGGVSMSTAMAESVPGPGADHTVAAEVEHYELEKPHTQILFFAEHLGFSVSNGRFTEFNGHFTLDRANPQNSSVEVVIDAASIYMGHEEWEAHMKNADFFDVEKYPEIRFKSESVELVDENSANVHGILSMHGVDKPVTLAVTHKKSAVHPFSGKFVAGFAAETSLLRSDFGMTFGLPLLADKVDIKIAVEGIRLDGEDSAEEAGEE